MADDYYGYIPGSVERLSKAGWIARHMGEDITHYPDQGGGTYVATEEPPSSTNGDEDTRRMMQNSIEKVHKRILAQSYTMVQDAANGWRDIADYLRDLSGQIRTQSDALRAGGGSGDPGWSSAGADEFMARGPGATMMSIDDWAEAAQVNHDGLTSLAFTIAGYHGKVKDLWDDYKRAMVQAAQRFLFHDVQTSYYYDDNAPQQVDDPQDIDVSAWQRFLNQDNHWREQDRYVDALKQEELLWTYRAQTLEYEMAQEYWQVMGHELGGGSSTVFEGPDNAVVPAGMPGTDLRPMLAAQDAAANLANLPTAPAIDTSKLQNLPDGTQQFQADIDDLTGKTAQLDETLLLAEQTDTGTTAPDLEAPSTAPGAVPDPPPPVVPPALGGLPGLAGLSKPSAGSAAGTTFPGSGNLAGGLTKGVLGGAKGSSAGAAPPPAGLKGGKVLGRQQGPQEALPQRPGAPGAPPPSLAGKGRPGQRAGPPPQEPTAGRLGGSPPGTTAPVLGGRGHTGGPTVPGAPAAPRPGPTRAGTAPPVLGSRSGRGGPPAAVPGSPGAGATPPQVPGQGRDRPPRRSGPDQHVDAPLEIGHLFPTTEEMGTARPTLHRPGPPPPAPRDVGEVPRGLRANRSVVASPAELAARRRAAKAVQEEQERERLEDNYQQIKAFMGGEEAWTVQTPGGPVMGGTERPAAPQAEPRPALGGG